MKRKSGRKAILIGGLIAGTLDLTDPIVFYGLRGVKAIRIPQSIASGLLGSAAFKGGWPAAALGVVLHFAIALTWAALFCMAARQVRLLTRHWVIAGLLYGGGIYLFMNRVVLPLSRVAKSAPPHGAVLVNGVLAVVVLVGLPIAWAARRYQG